MLSRDALEHRLAASMIGLVTLSVLLLSVTGLYALMAFTVTQRRREIGIRVALGANPRRILASILSRAFWQLGIGIALGAGIGIMRGLDDPGEFSDLLGLGMVPAVAIFVLLIGFLAAAVPARRCLRITPAEALRQG
jgi:ABC-type antimicrobial peptide transport system permease subunit